jgi:hypothetical protein
MPPPYRDLRNGPVIESYLRELVREKEKIERARARICRIRLELLELGVEPPPERLIIR